MARMLVVSNHLVVSDDPERRSLALAREAPGSSIPQPESDRGYATPEQIALHTETLMRVPQLLLLLDYDGTLVPIQPTPDLASPDAELRALLLLLAAQRRLQIHIVSGRSRDTLERWFGELPIHLHAEHGFWSRSPSGSWRGRQAIPGGWRRGALEILRELAQSTPGALVEQKHSGLAWHYRRCDPEVAARQVHALKAAMSALLADKPFEIFSGDKVIELRPQGVNKGLVASELVRGAPPDSVVAAFGDDLTDEDMFRALPKGALGFHVGPAPSCACVRLRDYQDVRKILGRLHAPPPGA